MRFIIFTLFIGSIVYAGNVQRMLLNIQNTNSINLKKFHLNNGWNAKDSVFISRGVSLFNYNKKTFLDDKIKYTKIAKSNAKSNLSKFFNSDISAMDVLTTTDTETAIIKERSIYSKSLLKNSFSFFQIGKLNKEKTIYKIYHYIIWGNIFSSKNIKSQLSIKEYISKINVKKIIGSRIFVDKKGRYFLLNFSIFKSSGNNWEDKRSSKIFAKREISSMLKSNINASSVLTGTAISEKESQKSIQKYIKGIKNILQKKFVDPVSKRRYYITVYASRINKGRR